MPQRWESRRAGAEGVSECVRERAVGLGRGGSGVESGAPGRNLALNRGHSSFINLDPSSRPPPAVYKTGTIS